MNPTTVVFVHGFNSTPDCWEPFLLRLRADAELLAQGFRFECFGYPTKFLQVNLTRRIPSIEECGQALGEYLENEVPEGELMLVGHSMGGLVIQNYLAFKIGKKRGEELQRIRSVIMFATPNRGSTILTSVRKIFSWLRKNEQEAELQVLDKQVADTNEVIVESLLRATKVTPVYCPIPFRVYWGLEDDIVPEVSARGPFVEASPLPGDHSGILRPDPANPRDQRFVSLKNALLNPIGHPSIYEISRFEVDLRVTPADPATPFLLKINSKMKEVRTDNQARRTVRLSFSRQNRCHSPYDQTYRSKDGYVELVSFDGTNEASDEAMSEYYETGKRYTYLFSPEQEKTYCMKLDIYNGFGEGQRDWHNHMRDDARYKLFRFNLDLTGYQQAGYALSAEPTCYFHRQRILDHDLCGLRDPKEIVAPLPSPDAWLRSWEIADVRGGVIDIAWDVQKPPTPA